MRLKDVARVELGAQLYNMVGKLNGKRPRSWRFISYPIPMRSMTKKRS